LTIPTGKGKGGGRREEGEGEGEREKGSVCERKRKMCLRKGGER
jgi:hypothetical protein